MILLCLGNISKDWAVNNLKQTGRNGYIYQFCVDYGGLNPFPPPPLNVVEYLSYAQELIKQGT